jgi:nickel/cobalt exporter
MSESSRQARQLISLLQGRWGFMVFLTVTALSFVWGAAHALMPGHAKTVVAAYLISRSGNYWHAVVLAVIVTVTHTALVVALGLIIWFYQATHPTLGARLQLWLGLIAGLLVAGMGLMLIWRALTGRIAHHHHEHDHHHSHEHDHDHGHRSWLRMLFTHSHPHVPEVGARDEGRGTRDEGSGFGQGGQGDTGTRRQGDIGSRGEGDGETVGQVEAGTEYRPGMSLEGVLDGGDGHAHQHHEHAHGHEHVHAHYHPHDHSHGHHAHDHSHAHGHPHDHHHAHEHPHDHHHPHTHAHDHGHDHKHGPAGLPSATSPEPLTFRTLLLLGITGGIVPCPTATIIMLLGIGANVVAGALYTVGIFSLGLALTLMLIGFLALSSRRMAARILSDARHEGELSTTGRRILFQAIPAVSGTLVIALGLAIATNYLYFLCNGRALFPWLG